MKSYFLFTILNLFNSHIRLGNELKQLDTSYWCMG